jgi:hypothetical protein
LDLVALEQLAWPEEDHKLVFLALTQQKKRINIFVPQYSQAGALPMDVKISIRTKFNTASA